MPECELLHIEMPIGKKCPSVYNETEETCNTDCGFNEENRFKGVEKKWKCPICNAESKNGQAVEHSKGCDYCEKKINRMLAKDKREEKK